MVKIWPGLLIALCAPLLQAAVSVIDDRGHTVTLAQPARRIVSLSPHLAEDLFAIGAGAQVVGTVDFSDYPPAAKRVARVGGYDGFDLERIRTLKPDLIVCDLQGRPEMQHVIITGRGAQPALIEIADTVTEMRPVKHAYEAGIRAQRGIEW